MSVPDDKRSKSPADRFRNIMADNQTRNTGATSQPYSKNASSPIMNLPKPGSGGASSSTASPAKSSSGGTSHGWMPAFWTVASVISLLFNAVLLVVLISVLRTVGSLDTARIGTGVLGGLYTNFERMDAAHIKTNIPVQTTVPLDLQVPVQTTTAITLARDVSIPGAHVRINSPLLNIDAPASVTLPAGTQMDVSMSFTLPVQSQIPISLNVPVDIPMQDTELHPAFVGLQQTIRPLYCMATPLAQSLTGQPVCR
ncbi:MAG: hypothetical protein ACM3MF_07495 [Anaerolineae bacterium]